MTIEFYAVSIASFVTLVTSLGTLYLSRKWRIKDISELTTKVESIKSDFFQKQAEYQARIELAISTRREILIDQKKAVVDFWDSHFELLRLCDTSRYEIDELRINEFIALQRKIEFQEEYCEKSFTRLYFYMDDIALIELAEKTNHQAMLNSIHFLRFLDSVEPLLQKAKESFQDTTSEKYREYMSQVKQLSDNMDEYLDSNDVRPLLNQFKYRSKSKKMEFFKGKL